jgi:hypothetical protein
VLFRSAMVKTFKQIAGVRSDVFVSRTNVDGASIIWRRDR